MKYSILTLLFALPFLGAKAQYVDQALKFSQQYYTGTARSQAMGNAFGALGGDFTSISINPAGLGVYRSSEVEFTATPFRLNNVETTYQGNQSDKSNYNFNFRNFGYVGSTKPNSSSIINVNFAIGYNRVNNFNFDRLTSAYNSAHSRTDAFAQNSYGYDSDNLSYDTTPWETVLAWENYLIYNQEGATDQYHSLLYDNETVNQRETYQSEGATDEITLAMGLNVSDKLYVGANLGIHNVYNKETRTYYEDGEFGHYNYIQYLKTTGSGFNAKLGLIYRPIPQLRLGAAVHTPTFYNLKELYYSDMTSYVEVEGKMENHEAYSPESRWDYDLTTPMRAIFSAAYTIGKKAIVSVDYEMVDYTNAELSDGGGNDDFFNDNEEIEQIYSTTHNFRTGIEYRINPAASIRAGYEYYDNPYNGNAYGEVQPNKNYGYNKLSFGFGLRSKSFYFDAAYSITGAEHYTYLYQTYDQDDYPMVEATKIKECINELIFTVGHRF